ncbi:MAG TPA: rod shape-determining protein RodA [Bacteroidota bacterium]|jgi:rod shape determining protein RodA|nr:rod shape-determining protein RodA [Bacteroidota bacterium]
MNYWKEYFDFKTFILCIALVSIGLLSIYSATFDVNNAATYYRQLQWAVFGFVVMMVVSFLPLSIIRRFAFAFYVLTLVVLAAVLVIGSTVKGSKSWFGVGGLGGQPSEFAKVATVLAFASYLSKPNITITNTKQGFLAILIFITPMALILAQPDLGTTVVFLGTLLPLFYWIGASPFLIVVIISPIIVALGALWGVVYFLLSLVICGVMLYVTHTNKFALIVMIGALLLIGVSVQAVYERLPVYQQKRIATFMNPEADPLGSAYNVTQSKIAIGSGGFVGKGFLRGTQTQLNYIPEQWTDFIFCVPAEEFGFIGSLIVLLLFLFLILHGITIASKSKNLFGSIAAIGFTAILFIHTLINIGMSLGLMPVIGIPLPFMSYGGSALVADMMMAGLLMNFYSHRKEH